MSAEQFGIARDELRSFIRRIENLEEEIKGLNCDKSDVYKEAKGRGFDVKIMRKCVAARRVDADERSEQDAIYDLYMSVLDGNAETGTEIAIARAPAHATPAHDPETGEILESVQSHEALVLSAPAESASGEISATNQPETANEVPAQDGGGNELGESLLGKSNAARPASVDAHVNDGRLGGEVSNEVVTAGETASNFHSQPVALVHDSDADTAIGLAGPACAQDAAAANTKPAKISAGDAAGVEPSPSVTFINPKCLKPKTCPNAHSKTACFDCVMEYGKRPPEEQKRLWAEAIGDAA